MCRLVARGHYGARGQLRLAEQISYAYAAFPILLLLRAEMVVVGNSDACEL